MNGQSRTSVVAIGLGCLVAASAQPAGPPVNFFGTERSPLLYVSATSFANSLSLTPSEFEEWYIFEDGTALATATHLDPGTLVPAANYLASAVIPSAHLAQLRRALRGARPGAQKDCTRQTPFFLPKVDYLLTWFGASGRKNTFAVREADTSSCPAAVLEVVQAARLAAGYVWGNPTTRLEVPDRLPPGPCPICGVLRP